MPTYTYRCSNCHHQLDYRQGFSEENIVKCPNCGKHKLVRVYKPVGVVFKGSGFYATDNRSPSRIQNGKPSTTDEEKDTTKKTEKVETTSEKKDEKKKGESTVKGTDSKS